MMSENCVSLIDRLIEQRRRLGLTQQQLAQASNLTQPAIARLESKSSTPQLNTLLRVADALGCSLELVPVSSSE